MKKLALVSAIAAATMVSMNAHATFHFTTGGIEINTDITVPCAIGGTYSGGPDGVMSSDAGTTLLAGTICMDPGGGIPYVMLRILMADAGTPLLMEQGSIQILTNWSAASEWTPYSTVAVTPSTPISCTDLTPPANPGCALTFFGNPAVIFLN